MNCYHVKIKKVRGKAKIEEINSGMSRFYCKKEDNSEWHPTSDFNVLLSDTGKIFGDCLYDGHWENFYFISEEVLNTFLKYQTNLIYYNVIIDKPIPKQYKGIDHLKYFSLDYRKLNVVNYDLSKYPYTSAWTCPECNSTRSDTQEFFNDIHNDSVKPRPFNIKDYNEDNLFRVECGGLGCSEKLKKELENNFKNSFEFDKILFNE